MRICISIHSMNAGGGIQERRVSLANEWVRHGHDVTIVCPVPPQKTIERLSSEVRLVHLGNWPDKLRYHKMYCVVLLSMFFKREGEFDAVIASTSSHIFLTSIGLLLAGNRSPLYGTVHVSLDYSGGMKQVLVAFLSRLELRLSALRTRRFAGVSSGVACQMRAILPAGCGDVDVLYNPVINEGIDEGCEPLDRRLYAREDQKIVIAVGRLHRQKGFDLLIKAFRNVKTEALLLIVGDGEDMDELKELSERLGISQRIRFLGYHSNVMSLLKMADCFVLSSRWEGLGNVVVEALYAQVNIVSFDCPHGPEEILEHGKWGKVVRCGDTSEMAQSIDAALASGMSNVNGRWRDFYTPNVAMKYLGFMGVALDEEPCLKS